MGRAIENTSLWKYIDVHHGHMPDISIWLPKDNHSKICEQTTSFDRFRTLRLHPKPKLSWRDFALFLFCHTYKSLVELSDSGNTSMFDHFPSSHVAKGDKSTKEARLEWVPTEIEYSVSQSTWPWWCSSYSIVGYVVAISSYLFRLSQRAIIETKSAAHPTTTIINTEVIMPTHTRSTKWYWVCYEIAHTSMNLLPPRSCIAL
jgi:hypothetical protein